MSDEHLGTSVLRVAASGNAQAPPVWPSLGKLGGLTFALQAVAFPQAGLSMKLARRWTVPGP